MRLLNTLQSVALFALVVTSICSLVYIFLLIPTLLF